ncbi:MAG: hypothetical protein IPK26_27220 [Planctomycetes bacterium]|nr:hypothetical protein [Planctomycetota bacterium]
MQSRSNVWRPGALFARCLCLLGLLTALLPAQRLGRLGEKVAPPPPALAGRLEGIAREPLSDGKVLEYPIALTVSGADDALRFQVSATAQVPVEGGGQIDVAITAIYAGKIAAGEVTMRSEQIRTRIVTTGEEVPVAPQQLIATWRNGVLSGKTGSDAEGWTTFEARPVAERDGRLPIGRPAAGLRGTFRGQGREPGPNGRELVYPVLFQATEQAADFAVEVKADIDYPIDGGGTIATEYRAKFLLTEADGAFAGRSEKAELHIPSQQRTVPLPGQQIKARFDGETLRVQIGDDREGWSRIELRRDQVEIPRDADHREVRPVGEGGQPVDEIVTGGDRSAGVGEQRQPPLRTATKSAYQTLVLERRELTDPGFGGIASHSLLVPKGWQLEGGVQWTGHPEVYVHLVAAVRGEHGESLHFDWNRALCYSNAPDAGGQPLRDGEPQPDGSIVAAPPQRAGDAAMRVILPSLRPGATDIEQLSADTLPDVEEQQRAALAPLLKMLEEGAAGLRQMGVDNRHWLHCERVRVRYRQDGQAFEEELRYTVTGMHQSIRTDLSRSDSGNWRVLDVATVRAPAGRLDACLPTLWSLSATLQATPRWHAALGELRRQIMAAKTQGIIASISAARDRALQESRQWQSLSDEQHRSWREQNDASDRVHKAQVDALKEVHDFRDSDGDVHTVTNHFDRAFKNPNGGMILSNDPNYRPAGDASVNQVRWEELQRVDPFRSR